MKLKNKLSKQKFEYEFLKGEWYKDEYNSVRNQFNHVIENPDFNSPQHNQTISSLLWALRKPLLDRLPTDTEWWEAELENNDFENILIIRETGWEATFGGNKKMKDVAQAIIDGIQDKGMDLPKTKAIQKNIGSHSFSEKLILISENVASFPTIIEGNHRALAFQLEKLEKGTNAHIPSEIIIGLSPSIRSCAWWNWID